MNGRLEVVPLPTPHRFVAGDDLAGALTHACTAAGVTLRDGDVVVVASKVISKVEGAVVELADGTDPQAARRAAAAAQAVRVVADTPAVLVVETHHGFVCANAGIDASNVGAGGRTALLLPHDPDASAARLRDDLRARTGADVGVLITDTFGRPWRLGQTDVAIGAAGIVALRDERGSVDLDGRTLEVTMVALADELAAAADLVRRKADGTPFVLVRGAEVAGDGRAADLVRPAGEDVFRWGGANAVEEALAAANAAEPRPDCDEATLGRIARAARRSGEALGAVDVTTASEPARIVVAPAGAGGTAALAVGAAVAAARAVAAALGQASRVEVGADGSPVTVRVGPPVGG